MMRDLDLAALSTFYALIAVFILGTAASVLRLAGRILKHEFHRQPQRDEDKS